MILKTFCYTLALAVLILVLGNCNTQKHQSDLSIDLRWVESYPGDSHEKATIGLQWILSYLGATNENDYYKEAISWQDSNILTLKLDKLGFSLQATKAFTSLIEQMKEMDEYKQYKSIDLGYFVMQTFNNSWHYYEITGVPKKLEDFKSKYKFDNKDDFLLLPGESAVANGIRVLNIAKSDSIYDMAFMAKEGHGLIPSDFKTEEIEVFDFMENGQPRFAVYDIEGNLKNAGNKEISRAGKPAKCMWCHESMVAPLIKAKTNVEGYQNLERLQTLVKKKNRLLRGQQINGDSLFYWKNLKDHSLAELLYVLYEQPTLDRLKAESILLNIELSIDSSQIKANEEYGFYGLHLDSVIQRKYTTLDFHKNLHLSREEDNTTVNLLLD